MIESSLVSSLRLLRILEMNKRNAVAKLNRTYAHRKAMLRNMAESLFEHERIVTGKAKAKALRPYAEKLITRSRKALSPDSEASTAHTLHIRRLLLSHLRSAAIVKKLMEDIAVRFEKRMGGYIRIVHLADRKSDASPMSIIELVERKEKVQAPRGAARQKKKQGPIEAEPLTPVKAEKAKAQGEQGAKKESKKWYSRLRRKQKEWD